MQELSAILQLTVSLLYLALKKDLTAYLEELIMGLETEYKQGILTKWQYEESLRLVHIALNHMLHDHPTLRKEATRMTECRLKFISDIIQEYEDDIAAKEAIITEITTEKDAAITKITTEKDAAITKITTEKDAVITKKNAIIKKKNATIAKKDAEIAALKLQLSGK